MGIAPHAPSGIFPVSGQGKAAKSVTRASAVRQRPTARSSGSLIDPEERNRPFYSEARQQRIQQPDKFSQFKPMIADCGRPGS